MLSEDCNDLSKRKKRCLFIASFILLVSFILVVFLYPSNFFVIDAYFNTYVMKKSDWVDANKPVTQIHLEGYKAKAGDILKYHNFEFRSPYGTPLKTKKLDQFDLLSYENDIKIYVYDPIFMDFKSEMGEKGTKMYKDYYEMKKNSYTVLVSDLKLFGNKKDNTMNFIYLAMKRVAFPYPSDQAHFFEDRYKGFIHLAEGLGVIMIEDNDYSYQLVVAGVPKEDILTIANSFKITRRAGTKNDK